jgi:hypothetical protein
MSRIFVSHSRRDNLEAVALVQWLSEVRPELTTEIFIDIGAETGLRPGQKWQEALRQASDRCEAVICLLSRNWQSSDYCRLEYLLAENLGKQILVARLEDLGDIDITSKWQRCDLFAKGAQTDIAVTGGGRCGSTPPHSISSKGYRGHRSRAGELCVAAPHGSGSERRIGAGNRSKTSMPGYFSAGMHRSCSAPTNYGRCRSRAQVAVRGAGPIRQR